MLIDKTQQIQMILKRLITDLISQSVRFPIALNLSKVEAATEVQYARMKVLELAA